MIRALVLVFSCLSLVGCGNWLSPLGRVPQSVGEKNSGFTYIPLDPLTVEYPGCQGSNVTYDRILDRLPDNAVRIASKRLTGKSDGAFGPVGIGSAGEIYKVVLDYVNVDNTNIPFSIKTEDEVDPDTGDVKGLRYQVERLDPDRGYVESYGSSTKIFGLDLVFPIPRAGIYVIPVYVGVGLRLTAEITVLRGNVNLSSLPGIAASVEAGDATGSLVVQTLGVTGKQISTGLIFSSDLNETTVQNAVLSLGKIKAILYSNDAIIQPRVTGMYLPLPDGSDELVNLIVSELARQPIPWKHKAC